jgi:glycosyltransferase involved in cell wall biosynthesis
MRDLFRVEREGLREGIRLARPDILHAHWTYEFAMACLETNLPVVITTHDNAFQQLRFSKDLYRLGRLYIQIKVIRKARFLTAESPYAAKSLQWLARTQIEVIPNPVDVPQVALYPSEQSFGSLRIATMLNGWGTRKNPKAAIKAFALVRREFPNAQMSMYGYDFEQGGPAWKWASSRRLSENIQFCGFLPPDKLQRELRQTSILLHPSLEESFGMVLIEAMVNGIPVVAGIKSGAVPWVLDEGKAGFLTDVRDPKKIVQTVLTCIQQREVREERRKNARCRVLKLFSPGCVAEQYESMYEKALTVH